MNAIWFYDKDGALLTKIGNKDYSNSMKSIILAENEIFAGGKAEVDEDGYFKFEPIIFS